MKLSMCLIAGNEAANVVESFTSWWDDVDDVVLLCSGDDNTAFLAREFAKAKGESHKLKVVDYGWRNDFAHARNEAQRHASGDWITWADLDDTVHGMGALRKLAEEAGPEVGAMFCLYEYAVDANGHVICQLWRERMVRAGAAEWVDRVHESQVVTRGLVARVEPDIAKWTHRKPPFTPSDRNKRILLDWERDEPENGRVLLNLAREFLGAGEHAEAIERYERFLTVPGQQPDTRVQARRQLGACYAMSGELEKAMQQALAGVAENALWADNYLTMAEIEVTTGRWREAIMHSEQVEALGMPDSVLILNPDDYTLRPKVLRACALQGLGNLDEAIRLGHEVARVNPAFMDIAPSLGRWEGERQIKQTVDLFVEAANVLRAYDEPLKAEALLDNVPYYCSDHPALVGARVQTQDVLRSPYVCEPVTAESPRGQFLLAGLREQMKVWLDAREDTEPFRVLDPPGVCREMILAEFPDVAVDDVSEGHYYDAILFYCDLDNMPDPEQRVASLTNEIAVRGRAYVSVREGRAPSSATPGRKRAWRNSDVAALCARHGTLESFGIDEDGYISCSFVPVVRRGEVAVVTLQAIGKWHPTDIVEKGLGGSETAAWRLAEYLSKAGYAVTLFGDFEQDGICQDVMLKQFTAYDPTVKRRATIAFRNATIFDRPLNSDRTFLWLEDVAGWEGITPERMEHIDFVCSVSEWHSQNIAETYPFIAPEKILTSRNGIMLDYFNDGEDIAREPRLLYTSSPDRGLDVLLEIWPEIKKRVPDAEFLHCYSRWWDFCADGNPESARHRERVIALSEADGVRKIPSQGQIALARLMRSSRVWANPGYYTLQAMKFNETNCISVQEAQAAGCYTVGAAWGALGEMNVAGVKIDGDPMSAEFRQRFIDEIVRGLTDPETQAKAERDGPEAMKDRGWEGPGGQLELLIGG